MDASTTRSHDDDDDDGVSDTNELANPMSPIEAPNAMEDINGDGHTTAEEIAGISDSNPFFSIPASVPTLGSFGPTLVAILLARLAITTSKQRSPRRGRPTFTETKCSRG